MNGVRIKIRMKGVRRKIRMKGVRIKIRIQDWGSKFSSLALGYGERGLVSWDHSNQTQYTRFIY